MDWARILTRFFASILLALCVCASFPTQAGAQGQWKWSPNPDDALILELRLKQYTLGEGIRGYQTPDGACVDFGDMLMALDLPIKTSYADGVAVGWAFREANQIEVNRLLGTASYGGQHGRLSPSAIRDTAQGWCVDTTELSKWFGVELRIDIRNTVLLLVSNEKLPLELSAERKARLARIRPLPSTSGMDAISEPYSLWRAPAIDAVVSIGGLRDSKRGNRLDRHYELYAAGEVARSSYDIRLASDRKGIPESLRVRLSRTDIKGNLFGKLHATYAALGDVASIDSPLVGQSTPGRGAVITNRPVDRPDSFDRTTIRGELPGGWDAELYRNGQLLQATASRSDGRYEFTDVQLLYGQNQLEVVLYGPQGQVRRTRQFVSVGQESIAAGKTYYWAGVTQDNKGLIEFRSGRTGDRTGWRGAFGVEHGFDARTSVAALLYSYELDHERSKFAELSLRRSMGQALVEMSGSYEAGGGYALRSQMVAQFGQTYLSGESIFARNFESERVEKGLKGRHIVALDRAFLLGRAVVPAHFEARYVQRLGRPDTLELGTRLSTSVRNVSLTGAVDWRDQGGPLYPGAPARLEAALLANGGIGAVRLRGEARWSLSPGKHFETGSVIAQWMASEHSDWRAEVGYDRKLERGRGAIGWSRRGSMMALGVTAEAATDGSLAASLNLAFSFGRNPRSGGFRVTSSKLASRGSALAYVFRDLNNDGIRQPDEPAETNVQINAGRVPVARLTGKDGAVVIDDLQPFRPVNFSVDTSSLENPLLQPREPILIVPRPGVTTRIEIPIVGSGEVEGSLVRAGGGPLEGVDLELVARDGKTVWTARSEYDGYFLFQSIPYGNYLLRVAKTSAAALGISPSLTGPIAIEASRPTVRLGTMAVRYERMNSMASSAP